MARANSSLRQRLLALLWLAPIAALLACDGGMRGSGISGSVVSGSLAASWSTSDLTAAGLTARGAAVEAVVVRLRGMPEVQTVVDPVTRNFTLAGVPPGDATIDFISSSTASISLRGLPEGVELRMVNVRFDAEVARPAGFAVLPGEGNRAEVVSSRRKGPAPLQVTLALTEIAATDPARVVWSFGDGTQSGRSGTSHTYETPGNYVVEAVISDGNDQQRAFEVIQVLSPDDRSLRITASAEPDRGLPPLSVLFAAAAENNVGAVAYEWDFDDDTAPGSGSPVRHTFTREGIFLVQVVARDEAGSEERDVVQVEVSRGTRPVPLSVQALVDSPIGPAPHRVTLRAVITGSGPVSIDWDFDDGTAPTSEPSPEHTYASPGIYFATVRVTELQTGESVFDQVAIEVL